MSVSLDTSCGLLADRARSFADRPFVATQDGAGALRELSYRDGAAIVAGLTGWLEAQGLAKGDRLLCYLDASDPGIWLYFACSAAGVIAVPLGPSFSVESLGGLGKQCAAKAVFTTRDRAADVAALGLPVLVAPDPLPREAPERLAERAEKISGDDVLIFQPTSGSTGAPKLVMRRNCTFTYGGRVMAAGLPMGKPDHRGLVTAALTHGAAHYFVHALIYVGACVCLPREIDTKVKLDEAERFGVDHLLTVPRVLRALLRQHDEKYGDGAAARPFLSPRMHKLSIGGAPSDDALLAELERRDIEVSEGYGATEVSLVAMTGFGRRKAGSVGEVQPEMTIRIATDGELLVRSPVAMAGYFGDEAQTRASYDDEGYYKTGDLAALDGDGYLRILGRKKDVFNSAEGSNIYPTRIEEMLESCPSIGHAVLVGDVRPYVVALVTLRASPGGDGVISPQDNPQIYAPVYKDVREVNARLEGFERVRRVAIVAGAFDADVYKAVGQGKIARDRKKTLEVYAAIVEQLYDKRGASFGVEA